MTTIERLTAADLRERLDAFCHILIDAVHGGAAVRFMAPLPREEAARYWLDEVARDLEAGRLVLLAASLDGATVGTVQLVTAMAPNQPHRCEIAKMIVHPDARRRGIARALMLRALDEARALGKRLVTLDTRTGDIGQSLYGSVGFEEAGTIPDFALDPDGGAFHGTTYMYLRLPAPPGAALTGR